MKAFDEWWFNTCETGLDEHEYRNVAKMGWKAALRWIYYSDNAVMDIYDELDKEVGEHP